MQMACLFKKELKLEKIQEWFRTDSRVIIGYIKNDSRGFKTFVANRVQQIRENTDVQQWHHVPTRENPADGASRGLLGILIFTLGYSTMGFHCFVVMDVFLYIPRLMLVFQDVSVCYEY